MQPSREGGRGVLVALFVVYLLLLTWLLLWKFEIPWVGAGALRRIKLVPFVSSAGAGGSAPREVLANIAFFVPFGSYLALLAPAWRWWKWLAVLAGASLVLEAIQYMLAIGSSDVTDVIANTAGGLAGVGLIALLRRKLHDRTVPVMTRVCAVGTVFALLATGIFVASPLRYAPPRGAAALSTRPAPPATGTRPGPLDGPESCPGQRFSALVTTFGEPR